MIYNYKNDTHPVVINIVNNIAKGLYVTLIYAWNNKCKKSNILLNPICFFVEGEVRLPILLQGLEFVQRSYGSLPWYDVIKPSVKLAREGFVVSKDFVNEISKNAHYGMLYGLLNPGDILRLPELANTLDIVAEYGSKGTV